jgi:quercetin dioxygenase-like cupin family protein
MEERVQKLLTVAALALGLLAVFSAGFATGQRSAPRVDHLVQQTLLTTIDLTKAIGRLDNRELRMSRVTVAPNGHIGLHSHKDDPTIVYLIDGVLTNYHDDGTTEELHTGQAEFGPKSHWVENRGPNAATFVFASVSRRE